MRNIAILLIMFLMGFSISYELFKPSRKDYQVKEELIQEWKGQWCSESCHKEYPTMDLTEICNNFIDKKKQELIEEWSRGYEEGYKAR